ncbi:cysteine hydrolase [Bradyrhizobium manausense]|uniref:cysteine hydrolase n=1 Tax=Bradyrhizobium TaxID=374 RepID=UPI001BA4D110|nr:MULTISPECIES: cysteine hydrolase [Bradyrhizobium]MBR0831511.1 cysteine hydrolase [Bradyrhizobium manausense]UVO27101.1 cysteine hydrolase [Bradyrhizobium arachidis]
MGVLLTPVGANAAHVCIDMQRLFAPGAPWATPWLERVLPQIRCLVLQARERTVFTRFIPPRSADDAPGAWKALYRKWECVTRDRLDPIYLELVDDLSAFVPPASVFDRGTYCAFANGRLHWFLQERHVDTVIVSGGETDVCVLSTVLAAVDLGYRVILAEDALCSQSDQSHDALISLYTDRFSQQIEVASTASILALWPQA